MVTSKTAVPVDDSRRAKMESIYRPILAAGKEESFYSKWGDWFVLTETVEDQRRPGLLKSKFHVHSKV